VVRLHDVCNRIPGATGVLNPTQPACRITPGVDASTAKNFDFGKYRDVYTDKLTKLIEAKVAGAEIVAPPVQEQAQIINLMDALRQSVDKAKGGAEQEEAGRPPKKVARSDRPATEKRKRKTS